MQMASSNTTWFQFEKFNPAYTLFQCTALARGNKLMAATFIPESGRLRYMIIVL